MRQALQTLAIVAAIFTASTVHASVPACNPEDTAKLPEMDYVPETAEGASIHPVIAYPFGSRKSFGFDVEFVVDPTGHVTCIDIIGAGQSPDADMTPQRQAELDRMSAQIYKPWEIDGKPVTALAGDMISEEQLPRSHVAPPHGDLSTAHIHQDWQPDMLPMPEAYSLDIYGDGRVVYQAVDDDLIGTQTYRIDPSIVQSLLDKAAEVDFWSYDDDSMRSAYHLIHASAESTQIDYGGRSQTLGYALIFDVGVPRGLEDLESEIADAGHVDWWNSLPLEAIDHLQSTGFDFKGRPGSDLLSRALNGHVLPDSIARLLALGAPVMWDPPEDGELPRSPLTAALQAGQTELARSMIAAGALLIDNKPNRLRVDSAFVAAISGGSLEAVNLILPYDPDMAVLDPVDGTKTRSVLLWLVFVGEETDEAAIAERLIARGAPVSATDSDGQSILSLAVEWSNFTLVKILLAHGASPDAIDASDRPPLSQAQNEDMVMILLQAGADPAKLTGGRSKDFYNIVRSGHWPRVRAWLESHGIGDALKMSQ